MIERSSTAQDIAKTASPREAVLRSEAIATLSEEVTRCRACPRLVEWRERVGREKRRAFRGEEYWARPVPGFGDPEARILILGLAPAAHGANRTGRMFTGDRSGDWLYSALYRAGLANQPTSERIDDGLELRDVFVTASVRCAPPDNKPLVVERDRCYPFIHAELDILTRTKVIVCLGGFAWGQGLQLLADRGETLPRPKPRFGHGAAVAIGPYELIGSYHPSQQNTFTGRLTEPMFDDIFRQAVKAANRPLPDQSSAVGTR